MFRVTVIVAALFALLSPSVALAADELSTTDRLDARRFVTAGPRAYEVGTEAGRYPGCRLPHARRDGRHLRAAGQAARRHLVRRRRRLAPARRAVHERPRLRQAGGHRAARADRRAHGLRPRRVARGPDRPALRGDRRRADVRPRDAGALRADVRLPVGRDEGRRPGLHPAAGQPARQRGGERRRQRAAVHRLRHAARHARARLGGRGRRRRHRDRGAARRARLGLPRPAGAAGHLPALRGGHARAARTLRRHRVRQGRRRPADLPRHGPRRRRDDDLVRRRGLAVRRRRRARDARARSSPTPPRR